MLKQGLDREVEMYARDLSTRDIEDALEKERATLQPTSRPDHFPLSRSKPSRSLQPE